MTALPKRWICAMVALAALGVAAVPAQPISAQLDTRATGGAALPTEIPTMVMPPVPTVAPGYRAPQSAPSAGIIGVTQQPFVAISLQDAIAMSLLSNTNLAISASNFRIAHYDIAQARGAYDVALHLQPQSNYSVNPPQNFLAAGPGQVGVYTPGPIYTTGPGDIIQHQSATGYGLSGQTVSGTTYQAGIEQSRTYNNTLFNAFNPQYLATLNLAVNQPLLKNFGMNATKRTLQLAVVNADAGVAQTLIDASNTISQVEDTYWDLVAAWRNVAIQEAALQEAVKQQQSNVRLAQRGAGAPIDAVESQTQISNFQTSVFRALQNVSQLQNRLKSLVASNANDPIWAANLVPSTSVEQLPSAADLATVVAEAKANRPEVRQALDRRLAAAIDVAYAKNQSLPQADVQAQYQSNGFAGLLTPVPKFILNFCQQGLGIPQCPTPPPNTQGSMPWAYHNMWAGYFPTFNIAMIVGYPLQGHVARGGRGLASEETTQAKILMQGVEERIGAEARNALQSYQSALSKLGAARQGRESAEVVYASELRKFRSGESTTFLVLQRQVELQQARSSELRAQTQLNQSIVELQRVEGTILRTNGVNVQTLGSQALTHQ